MPSSLCSGLAARSRLKSESVKCVIESQALDGLEMKPRIDATEFGSITIDGCVIEHDVIVRLGGKVKKRKKKLSKRVYNTSHIVSLDEAKHVFEKGAERLIVGSGQQGMVVLSDEAEDYFRRKGCAVELAPTPVAVQRWNKAKGAVIGLFHVTC